MAFARKAHRPSSNWFLTWDDESHHGGKSFLLQVKIRDLVHRNPLTDVVNSYAIIHRRHNGENTYTQIGTTSLIQNDCNPEYPDGFRIYYDRHTDLADDFLNVVCYHRREVTPSYQFALGSATITVRELVRAFGARINVELVRQKDRKVVGSVWFIAEALPVRSPKGGDNIMQFCMSVLPPKIVGIKLQSLRLFLLVERERSDRTWSVVYRSRVYKRDVVQSLTNRHRLIAFKPFEIRQGELVLGMSAMRKIRFSFLEMARRGHPPFTVACVVTSVDQLMNEFQADSCLNACIDNQVVGRFKSVARIDEHQLTSFDIHLEYNNSCLRNELNQLNDHPESDSDDQGSSGSQGASSCTFRTLSGRLRASLKLGGMVTRKMTA